MNSCVLSFLAMSVVCLPLCVSALEARVETRNGVPTLLVNGRPMPPFILFHTSGGGAGPLVCDVAPTWQQFSYTFTAPCDDDNVGLHINNVAPKGDWYIDDARFFEGTPDKPGTADLLTGGDFEGRALPESWNYFLSTATGADAAFSLDDALPHSGEQCLRVHITTPGTAEYHVHVYHRARIHKGRTYTFSVWLRASDERQITMKAVHQAPPWTSYGGSTHPSDDLLRLGAACGLHIGTPPVRVPWPKDGQPPDFSGADTQIDHILSIDPKALIIPRLNIDAPEWWKQQHPGNRQVYDKGEYPMASPASTLWRRDASMALRLFLRHLEEVYGEHMLGYHVAAQSAGEWFYDRTWEKIMPCFEEPFRQAFAEWTKGRYGTVERLQKAWRKPKATFDTIQVPTLSERTTGELGVFRDPASQRFEIDFAEYMQVCLCEYLEECARLVKEETGGKKLGVFFYGYLYDVSGFTYGPAVSGHLRLRRALNSPHVDIFTSPISYFDRQAGGVGPFMAPVDSIQTHGKLWLNEDDTRTHLARRNAGFGRTSDMFETIGVYRRNFGHQLEHLCATWWMDFGRGWMVDNEIFDNFAETRDAWSAVAAAPEPFAPQVAIVTDEDSYFYLRNSNEISRQSVTLMRRMFNTMGCPVGLYLMQDFCDGLVPDSARFCVFLNAYRMTSEQRVQFRAQAAKAKRTVLWLYAPGYIREDADVANIADIIGFEVRKAGGTETSRVRIVDDAPAPFQTLPKGHAFGVEFRPDPLFGVSADQAGVSVCGTYEGTREAALALKRFPDWTSVFCGGLQVSAGVLRELARSAGVHIYCETNDVISARQGFVSIHATHEGTKTLILGRAAALRDLFSGDVLPSAGRHTFRMRKGETRAFTLN
ncbi:MAG: hypothetical protein HN742_35150 [Lentisphaerae bacterium]|jgi:beta-galactosidase|nr:hypothetical protein [Lentisphaerota bacterium]MBT4819102.1 hypothetical protein [Lentisphaerota bacterium]MBT5609193.1 hypothetical protein [Lentisphaerota bacterium]MBT7055196.1 hypothetical protein [Lentisphaerota bacterium]MBT7847161.1 hypothetical protein [Lentisphaerota bacterium]